MSSVKMWDPNEWEEHVKALLRVHYGPGQFVEVPAKHGGDFGIEGFGRPDGCAYQCYAAQEPLSTDDLYGKQRDKTTTDLGKFIKNKSALASIIGSTKISRWILVVPRFESAKLVQHLERKTAEVRSSGLPYVGQDFQACVETDEIFAIEREQLSNVGLAKIAVSIQSPSTQDVFAWHSGNGGQLAILEGKLGVLVANATATELQHSRDKMVTHLLEGQNVLQKLKVNYPQLYQAARRCKDAREHYLTTVSALTAPAPQALLKEVLIQFQAELRENVPGLETYTAEALVWEALSDWLVRCPLSFRGKVSA